MRILIYLFILVIVSNQMGFSQPGRKKIVEGNKLFQQEQYDAALNKYRDAQVNNPESPLLKFNIGDAEYKKNKYEEAIKNFEQSLNTDDVIEQSKAYYNMGNSLYRLGKLPESIMAYKKALELNPDDKDAKYNLEFVRKQLKDKSDKNQQNQNQQQQQQKQQNQQQQQNDQDKQQNQQEQQQQQQQQQQEEQQSLESDEEREQQEQQQQQQPVEPTEEMSKEDAERILQALQEDQEKMKDARKQKIQGNVQVLKDW